jgi:type IV pilus assembly protein PilM
MLKYNSKNYLQQDLPDYVFDCYYQVCASATAEGARNTSNGQKQKVLVGGARQQLIDNLQAGIKAAGLMADQVIPGVLGPVNSFEVNEPEAFARDVIALVDVGFQSTIITILDCGEIILNRVVGIGGDQLTHGLASSMAISYAEAENIKVGMPDEVQPHLEALLAPLGRELRASIDFFEHQRDKTVSQVFVSGGSARSEFVIQALQAELIIPCKNWNPTRNLQLSLPPDQMGELEQAAPQLSVALGAAAAAL